MPKFSANLSMLYTDLPFVDRFAAAARDEFRAVEYLGPYDLPAAEAAALLEDNGLSQALFNVPSGDWAAGERGIACLPDRVSEFRQGVASAIEYARVLGCPKINVLAGIAPQDADADVLKNVLVDNLKFAAPRMQEVGIQLLLEPINTRDIPGFFVSYTDQAEEILDRTGSDNIFLQYDVYHTQVMQGDLIPTFERLKARIAHVQIADNPGRHEPGTGEINFAFIFSELDRLGYDGWVGCEYKPKTQTRAGLEWMKKYV